MNCFDLWKEKEKVAIFWTKLAYFAVLPLLAFLSYY